LRRIRQTGLKTGSTFVRPIPAAALLSCVLSGALPAEAVLNPGDSMACCRGMKGTAGECLGNSCPMHLGARSKPATPAQHDAVCGVGRALEAVAGTPVFAPRNYFEQARSHDHAQAEVEHHHGGNVTQRNTPQDPRQQPAAGVASLGKPCLTDCCGVTPGSFTGLRRPRHAALLTDSLRPRPPTFESYRLAPSGQIKVAREFQVVTSGAVADERPADAGAVRRKLRSAVD
jgi:hypothetical protein